MKQAEFEELTEAFREGGAILQGKTAPSRSFVVVAPDVAAIRYREKASQSQFAAMLGISVKTLQNWEQGRFTPDGPARVLLHIMDRNPDAVRAVSRTLAKRVPAKRLRGSKPRGPKSVVLS